VCSVFLDLSMSVSFSNRCLTLVRTTHMHSVVQSCMLIYRHLQCNKFTFLTWNCLAYRFCLNANLLRKISHGQGRIYTRAKGARAQGGKFPGAAYLKKMKIEVWYAGENKGCPRERNVREIYTKNTIMFCISSVLCVVFTYTLLHTNK
jgi:hypothetical protein